MLRTRRSSWLCVVLVLAGCGGAPPQVPMVPEAARSSHFARVAEHLELGGAVYGYVDVDGDLQVLAEAMLGLAARVEFEGVRIPDAATVLGDLGFARVRAFGLSSERRGDGFVNRAFFLSDAPHEGLLRGLARPPHAIAAMARAPRNVDLLWEGDLAVGQQIDSVLTLVGRFSESTATEAREALSDVIDPTRITYRQALEALNGRVTLAARIEDARMDIEDVSIPKIEVLFAAERAGAIFDALEEAHVLEAMFARREEGGATMFEFRAALPVGGYRPVLAKASDGTVYAATSREFLEEFLAPRGPRLRDDEAFQTLSAPLPETGNAFYYVSPRTWSVLRAEIMRFAAEEDEDAVGALDALLPDADNMGMVGMGRNEEDGWLQVDVGAYSHKLTFLGLPMMYLGVLAAVAVPSFKSYIGAARGEVMGPIGISTNPPEVDVAFSRCYTNAYAYVRERMRLPRAAPWTPSTPPTPSGYPGGDRGWRAGGWRDIGFDLVDPHMFRYRLVVEGDELRCEAEGDMDGDGERSQFILRARLVGAELQRDEQIEVTNPDE